MQGPSQVAIEQSTQGPILDGKVAIVTGASSGMGAAISRSMVHAGARVVMVGRHPERLANARAALGEASGQATTVNADLCARQGPQEVVDAAVGAYSTLDIVVHSAGLFQTAAPDDSIELLARQWEINVQAPFALTVAALPHLRERGGTVLFVSSIAGRIGFPKASAYCATKGAVELMVKALALDEAPHAVRVNAIAPGNIRTPMNAALFEEAEYERAIVEQTPLGRIGEVDDIAPLAVFLASDLAGYVTGESIVVDGGWVAR